MSARRDRKIAAAIEEARALIQAGWVQGSMHWMGPKGQDHYCLVGALERAVSHRLTLTTQTLRDEVNRTLSQRRYVRLSLTEAMAFNDSPWTMKHDVLRVLDDTIARLRPIEATPVVEEPVVKITIPQEAPAVTDDINNTNNKKETVLV